MAEIAFHPRSRVRVLVMRVKGKRSEQSAPRSCVRALVIRVKEKKGEQLAPGAGGVLEDAVDSSQSVGSTGRRRTDQVLSDPHLKRGLRSLGGVGPYRGCKEMVSAISADKSTR